MYPHKQINFHAFNEVEYFHWRKVQCQNIKRSDTGLRAPCPEVPGLPDHSEAPCCWGLQAMRSPTEGSQTPRHGTAPAHTHSGSWEGKEWQKNGKLRQQKKKKKSSFFFFFDWAGLMQIHSCISKCPLSVLWKILTVLLGASWHTGMHTRLRSPHS